ncbi:DNA mismatch repair ATPase msh1 [Podila epigama]|nr:DNA mismatch repair ATPase msh1 [Podila epigama]
MFRQALYRQWMLHSATKQHAFVLVITARNDASFHLLGSAWQSTCSAALSRRTFVRTTIWPSQPILGNTKVSSTTPDKNPTASVSEAAPLGPKRSALTLDDLLDINPNPTLPKVDISASMTKVKPKKIAKSKCTPVKKDAIPSAFSESSTTCTDVMAKVQLPQKRVSPLRQQILDLEATHPDCVLLIRVGEFYELYDHNAVEYGPLLGLKMGSKTVSGQRIPFTGFPYRQLDRHLETLVAKHNLKVALCEQYLQDDRHNVPSRNFKRSVHRIITPGTLIDEQFLDQGQNNWLLAVVSDKSSHKLGLSWLDLSTGDFFTQETTYDNFPNDLARIRPREIILNSALRNEPDHPVLQTIWQLGSFVISFEDMRSAAQLACRNDNEILSEAAAQFDFSQKYLESFTNREQSACLAILRYVNHTQMGRKPVVQQPIEWQDDSIVKIDRNTIESLEIVRTMRDSTKIGSLLHHLDRTKTKAGSRLLSNWITSPLTRIDKINSRLDMIEFLGNDSHLMNDIDVYLADCRDAQRAVQKLSFGQVDPQDLISIRLTLESVQNIKRRMKDKVMLASNGMSVGSAGIPSLVKETIDNVNDLEHVCELIRNVVDENMSLQDQYGFINEE